MEFFTGNISVLLRERISKHLQKRRKGFFTIICSRHKVKRQTAVQDGDFQIRSIRRSIENKPLGKHLSKTQEPYIVRILPPDFVLVNWLQ